MINSIIQPTKQAIILFLLFLLFNAGFGRELKVGPDQSFLVPSAAASFASDGDTISIAAGEYSGDVTAWDQNNLLIRGVGGRAHMRAAGAAAQEKGTWIIRGNNTTIENIEFSESSVPDQNGAGIRLEGSGLNVRNCYFHDNENGILGPDGGGEVLVEYSEFARNGYGDGYSHNMYILNADKFTIRFCYIHHAKVGHNIKSRARKNLILYNRIMDEKDGTSSYAIDVPDGGLTYIIGNLVQQGPDTENSTIISYGAESLSHPVNNLYIVNNTIVNDRSTGTFIYVNRGSSAKIVNNIFSGNGPILSGPADFFSNLISADPGLKNRVDYIYQLIENSEAIDAGTDPGSGDEFSLTPEFEYIHPANGRIRPQVGNLDIGAYEFSVTGLEMDDRNRINKRVELFPNYPNPFNPVTGITYQLAALSDVDLSIFNIRGRKLVTLVSEKQQAGLYNIEWDATGFPSGVYVGKLTTDDGYFDATKLMLVK